MLFQRCRNLFARSIIYSVSNISRSNSIVAWLRHDPVLVSPSNDIYTNLALEHWIYSNLRFKPKSNVSIETAEDFLATPVVLLWIDKPCIVIGRHQNPWIEVNLIRAFNNQIKLARRHSGGGCVYHDEHNLNISIIGNRDIFERRQDNLKFVAEVLLDKYGVRCEPTKRHDLVQSETNLKISGSAAKLGKYNCYHHFTLLVNSDKEALYSVIRQKQQDFIVSNSTASLRSKIINLSEINSSLEINQVLKDLSNVYSDHLVTQIGSVKHGPNFPSINDIKSMADCLKPIEDDLQTWEWLYGMTPKFKLSENFTIKVGGQRKKVDLTVHINKGLIEAIDIRSALDSSEMQRIDDYLKSFIGIKFTYTDRMFECMFG